MQTQMQGDPQTTESTKKTFTPAPPRGIIKTGIPTDGYWLLAGLAKGGKSSLAASIPGAYILETELGGADRIAGWIQETYNLAAFREALAHGMKSEEVKIIVVDTLDTVLKWLGNETAQRYGLESMSDKKEGVNGFAVWNDLFDRVDRMTEKFKTCGKLVILTAHFKEPKLDSDGKLVITQSIEAPSSKISSHLCSHADLIGVCTKRRVGDKNQYQMRTHGDGAVGAYGGRLPELEDKTIILPKGQQWAAIMAEFDKAVDTKKSETNGAKETNKAKAGRKI